jgi:predicted ATP-grasp superfamily ATP-dependent carboligase
MLTYAPLESNTSQNLQLSSNHIVLLSIPSIGNVGQLAADALITTLQAKRIGLIDAGNCVLDVIGNDAYIPQSKQAVKLQGALHTAVEVFEVPEKNIILIQIRAPITQPSTFASDIVSWVKQCGANKILVLASANASWRDDNLIHSESEEQLFTIRASFAGDFWQQIPDFIPELQDNKELFIRGVAKHLLKQAQDQQMNLAVLLVLCNEGDNLNHGLFLAHSTLVSALRLVPKEHQVKWKLPLSWTFLYGNKFSQSLYD